MNYILKQYDIPLLQFSATNDSRRPEFEILWINKEHKHLLPLDMNLTPKGLSHFCYVTMMISSGWLKST